MESRTRYWAGRENSYDCLLDIDFFAFENIPENRQMGRDGRDDNTREGRRKRKKKGRKREREISERNK